jgi:23S rRNA pseudouridine2605 synthase
MRKGTVKIVVREGKKREVRLLAQKAGLDIVSLHRIRIGPLVLGNLEVGEFRPLTESEKKSLLNPNSAI